MSKSKKQIKPLPFKVAMLDIAAFGVGRKKLGKQELIPLLHWTHHEMALDPLLGEDLRKMSPGEQFGIFSAMDGAHNLAMDRLDYWQQRKGNISAELAKALDGRVSSLIIRNRVRGLNEQEKKEFKTLKRAIARLKTA